jgi:hypothetical protein
LEKRKKKSARGTPPPRPDMDRFRGKEPYGGRELLIFDPETNEPAICRADYASDTKRLVAEFGADAVARAELISGGRVEISVEERDRISDYVSYLESKVAPKLLGPRPLNKTQARLIEIEASAWAASAGGPKDKRSASLYQPWSVIAGLLPSNLAVTQRTLNRWRALPEYRAAFVRACAERLDLLTDGETPATKTGNK